MGEAAEHLVTLLGGHGLVFVEEVAEEHRARVLVPEFQQEALGVVADGPRLARLAQGRDGLLGEGLALRPLILLGGGLLELHMLRETFLGAPGFLEGGGLLRPGGPRASAEAQQPQEHQHRSPPVTRHGASPGAAP
ncbi:hypothetical protein ACN28S_53390 [Cystobacter fuscus]